MNNMSNDRSSGFMFEEPAKNPRKKANLISRLFFRYEVAAWRTVLMCTSYESHIMEHQFVYAEVYAKLRLLSSDRFLAPLGLLAYYNILKIMQLVLCHKWDINKFNTILVV